MRTFAIVADHFRELWRYRVLIESLVWREVKARYRGSVLGYVWTLLNPLLLLAVYRLVFTKYTQAVLIPNYAVFLFVGILPWLWLSSSVSNGAGSIYHGGALITRVCIPPQVLPAVAVLSNLVNLLFALPVALAAAAVYGIYPAPALAALPLVIGLELIFLYALALFLAALTVRFRDVEFLVQNIIMIWFFLTPIVYPLDKVPEQYRAVALANPATALLRPFQEIIYHRALPTPAFLALAAAWSIGLVLISVRAFESMRDTLAEEI
jgi:lipopolysaccharide transport system permease protein